MTREKHILTFEDFKDDVDSAYRLVLLAARRAKEIIRDAKVQGKILEMKPTELALRNILKDGLEGPAVEEEKVEPVAEEDTEDQESA